MGTAQMAPVRVPGGTRLTARIVPALLVLAVALGLAIRWTTVRAATAVDFGVYVAGGNAVLDGRDLYAVTVPNGHGGLLRFTYPPFAALLFTVLPGGGAAALWLFTSVSLACYAGVVILCGRATHLRWRVAVLLGALGLSLEPVQRTLLFGQVNLVLLALVLADTLWLRGRWRGVLVGVATGIKLTPLVVVLWFLLRRQYRAAATTVAVTALTVVVTWVVLPRDSSTFWFSAMRSTGRFGPEAASWGNQSVPAVVERAARLHDLSHGQVVAATFGLGVVAGTVAVVAAIRLTRAGRDLAALCAVALGGLLVAPVAWTHHYVWVVPVLFVLVAARSWLLVGLTSLVFFLPPMWALAGRTDDQLGYTSTELALSAAWVVWTLVLLAGWAVRPAAGAPARPPRDEAEGREVRPVLASRV